MISVHYGLGRHYQFLTPDETRRMLQAFWAALFLTPSAEALAKFSISVMLIRITTSKRWKIFYYSLIASFGAIAIITLVVDLTTCSPVALLWDTNAMGNCHRKGETTIAYLQGGQYSDLRRFKGILLRDCLTSLQSLPQDTISCWLLLQYSYFGMSR